ncbi:MAG: PAS domain S-box protein [Mariprofundus sp.]|nr:PAS domain S-box protein [Mariprofundus sp.]
MNDERLKNAASSGVLLISATVLLGWWLDHATLAAWLPGVADMTFNTALCFLLMAMACLRPGLAAICMGVAIFALLSLAQDLFGIHLGIDNIFFDSHGFGLTSPYPGRMAPNTALAFLLTSSALFLMNSSTLKQHLVTITHAMIMLLSLISLLGISMHLFITDVPQSFAHFASISLFTAISFLLLSISLLLMHVRQHQYEGVNIVLYSVVHLMYKLKYPHKFILISMVMLIPLAFLMVDKLSQLDHGVEMAKLKMVGIKHIQSMMGLLKVVPEHRGMLNAQLASKETFSDKLQQKTAEVDHYFAANHLIDMQHTGIIKIPAEWATVQDDWARIKTHLHDPMLSWRLHTEIIALLRKHLRDVGNITRLSYDDHPTIHNLVAAQLEILPQLFEKIGQLRGLGTGFLARKSLTSHEQLMLGSIASDISLLLDESQQLLLYGLSERQQPALEQLNHAFVLAIHAFHKLAEEQLITTEKVSFSPEEYFSVATHALMLGYALSGDSFTLLDQILQQRISQNIIAQYIIKLMGVLVIFLILYLFWGFYQSVMVTIQTLKQAVRRMQDGDMTKIEMRTTHDEMGEVVASFNAISAELISVSSHMKAVVDHTADGIITIDKDGVISAFNQAAQFIFGYLEHQVKGQNVTMLMPERFRLQHQEGLQRYYNAGGDGIFQVASTSGLKADGSEFAMELMVSSMQLDGQLFIIGMVRNITKRIELEQQLQHAMKMESVGALVGGVAHNFNNLLAGILGKAYLAKRCVEKRPEKAMKYLKSVEEISAQAGDMVKQLLTFSHKGFCRDEQLIALPSLIKESFETAKLGVSEAVTLQLNMPSSNMQVYGDANQIQQVLMNMMNNACDAVADSEEKCITVSLDNFVADEPFLDKHADMAAGEYACLTISDTGYGMNSETMRKIYDPFYTTKEVGSGTGLGLSTAFGSISSHKGAIDVESVLAKGTIFRVYLPLIDSIVSVPDGVDKQSVLASKHHELLLLIDDDALVIEVTQGVLENLGYQVLTARDGQQGLALFKKNSERISIVITDVVMPVMGGVAMFREMRNLNYTVPTIFITGYADGLVDLNKDEMQNNIVLTKPVHILQLSQVIDSMLRTKVLPKQP